MISMFAHACECLVVLKATACLYDSDFVSICLKYSPNKLTIALPTKTDLLDSVTSFRLVLGDTITPLLVVFSCEYMPIRAEIQIDMSIVSAYSLCIV